jgi:hypothetical protein
MATEIPPQGMTQRSRAGSFTGVAAGGRLMMLNRDAYT